LVEEALNLYRQTAAIGDAHRNTVKDLWYWMRTPSLGGVCITSDDGDMWKHFNRQDLLALDATSADTFTQWVTNRLVDIYHETLGRRIHVSLSTSTMDSQHAVAQADKTHIFSKVMWRSKPRYATPSPTRTRGSKK
jgi:hypothetical protein